MGSLAAAIWIAPELLWNPLSTASRALLTAWLGQINQRTLWDNNWRFMRVLVNGALGAVGAAPDAAKMRQDLQRLDFFHQADGWYSDGLTPQFDYYNPMAMHLYGLLYGRLSPDGSAFADVFAERARKFAPQFAAWFAPDGSALPIGRSLTYRFAQGAFWGALAFANVEALPWGQIKHLHLQPIRWWLRQPIFIDDGILSVGYGYPNPIMAEGYNASGSPYWAMKAFLPLALPEAHPFWTAEEKPTEVPVLVTSPARTGLVICRDVERGHVFALTNNLPHPAGHRHAGQKYGKFVYSTAFGFGTPVGGTAAKYGAGDNMLLVSIDGRDWRAREEFKTETTTAPTTLHSRWWPWPEVEIDTWLLPALPGHLRVHRIKTKRGLKIFEGGFPLATRSGTKVTKDGEVGMVADNGDAVSAVWDLAGERRAEVVATEPGTNVLYPLTVLPALTAPIEEGETWLFTAVAGLPGVGQESLARRWRASLAVDLGDGPRIMRGRETIWQFDGTTLPHDSPLRTAHFPNENSSFVHKFARVIMKMLRASVGRVRKTAA
jgi:hypothetical protein